jgi:hypothetical protein
VDDSKPTQELDVKTIDNFIIHALANIHACVYIYLNYCARL